LKFSSYEEYENAWDVIHSGILYWKKMRQCVEGKINLYVNPEEKCHYSIAECNENMKKAAMLLKKVEDDNGYLIDREGVKYNSVIIKKCLRVN
jgi:hypothetical protein